MKIEGSQPGELPAGVTARLILVRHGEPEAAAHGRCYGKLNVDLSARGHRQAARTAAWLARARLSHVYSSPRRRAAETARLIADRHGLDVTVDERLREIDFGLFEGLTYDDVAARYPDTYRAWMERPTEVEFPDGESFTLMRRRVLLAALDIRTKQIGASAAIVAHGGTARIILADALAMEAHHIFRLDQAYAAFSIIDYYDDTPIVRLMNYIPESRVIGDE